VSRVEYLSGMQKLITYYDEGLIHELPPELNSHGATDNRRRVRRFSFELRAEECAAALSDFAADRFSGEEINGKYSGRVSGGVRH
jgi:hypothetical protein